MREHYYAHVIYNNPGVYDYEFFENHANVNDFIKEIISSLKDNYDEIDGSEELNIIDFGGWEDFLEENRIDYDSDGWFPYEAIWNCIHEKLLTALNGAFSNTQKYAALKVELENYLFLLECANFTDGDYEFMIRIFDNSKDFAKYFFDYLMESIEDRNHFEPFRKRIENICYLIEERDFPKNEFQEGALNEWLNLYELTLD